MGNSQASQQIVEAKVAATSDSSLVQPMCYYHGETSRWYSCDPANAPAATVLDDKPDEFRILTFNIWFDAWERQRRWSEVVNQICERRPMVACLQEVVQEFLDLLLADPRIQRHYITSSVYACRPAFESSYGCLVLVRRSSLVRLPLTFAVLPLTTLMGRTLLSVEFQFRGATVMVSTAHFESLNSRRVRQQQLSEYFEAYSWRLQQADPPQLAVVTGDFNFCSYRNFDPSAGLPLEEASVSTLLPDFQDLWPTLHGRQEPRLTPPTDPEQRRLMGYTFDSQRNKNIQQTEIMRYDRMFARFNETKAFAPLEIEILDQPIKDGLDIWPSDHFGLLGTFAYCP